MAPVVSASLGQGGWDLSCHQNLCWLSRGAPKHTLVEFCVDAPCELHEVLNGSGGEEAGVNKLSVFWVFQGNPRTPRSGFPQQFHHNQSEIRPQIAMQSFGCCSIWQDNPRENSVAQGSRGELARERLVPRCAPRGARWPCQHGLDPPASDKAAEGGKALKTAKVQQRIDARVDRNHDRLHPFSAKCVEDRFCKTRLPQRS